MDATYTDAPTPRYAKGTRLYSKVNGRCYIVQSQRLRYLVVQEAESGIVFKKQHVTLFYTDEEAARRYSENGRPLHQPRGL